MTHYERLMQPGDDGQPDMEWKAKAHCLGDDRFTGHEPDEQTHEELTETCLGCPVFMKCGEANVDSIAVFAAGEWKHEQEEG